MVSQARQHIGEKKSPARMIAPSGASASVMRSDQSGAPFIAVEIISTSRIPVPPRRRQGFGSAGRSENTAASRASIGCVCGTGNSQDARLHHRRYIGARVIRLAASKRDICLAFRGGLEQVAEVPQQLGFIGGHVMPPPPIVGSTDDRSTAARISAVPIPRRPRYTIPSARQGRGQAGEV
jgi:hypothetical protein